MNLVFHHGTVLPVTGYGGTERIIFWLMKELVQLGYQVSFIGPPGSQLAQHGIHFIPMQVEEDWRKYVPIGTDLVHLFSTPSVHLDWPTLVTIEGNGKENEVFHLNTVFVSRSHAAHHGSQSFVYNGIDLTEYPLSNEQVQRLKGGAWENFLFLAKAKWKVKNLRGAVRAARKAKKKLHVAGGCYWIPWSSIRSYGIVDQKKKIQVLQACDALLFPVRWHEPFGIAVVEAMAMGVPVIASPFGSLSELVSEDVGFLVGNEAELVEALKVRRRAFDPQSIRNYVELNFSSKVMAQSYLSLYWKILRGESLNSIPPQALPPAFESQLLPF